jgi:tetratricopeptide (TPR) repeat protein
MKSSPLLPCLAALALSTAPALAANTWSAPALFNQANAEQRAGQLGPAIRDYERALLLAPRDPAIAHNLEAAREKAGISQPAASTWHTATRALNLNALAILVSICLLLLCTLLFGNRLLATALRGLGTGLASVLGVTSLLALTAIAARWPELDRAVVQPAHATAHLAPAASSESVFELKGGDTVQPHQVHGAYTLIRSADGRTGWIAQSEIERILPRGV